MKLMRSCPVCFSKQIKSYVNAPNQHGKTLLQEKEKFTYYHCDNCDSIFLNGITIDKAYYQTYYSFPETQQKVTSITNLENKFDVMANNKKRSIIESHTVLKKKKIELLDIGCGKGNFLASLDKIKYQATGIELDKKEYLICKQKGLNVYCSDILKQNFASKQFDVITLWHVIEHIPDPHKLLKKLRTLLKKDGVLIMTTPNARSLGLQLAKEKWFHLDAPRHLILYSQKGMDELSSINGFVVKKVLSQTFEFPLDLFWSIKHSKMKYLIYPLYPLMKYRSKETLTHILTKSHEK